MKNMETQNWTLVFGGYEVKQDCPLRVRRHLVGFVQFRPLLAQHPPHRSQCSYFWIGLKMKMPMTTPLCVTLPLCLKSVVLLPRMAVWCLSLCNSVISVISIDVAAILASFSVTHVLVCKLLLPNGALVLGVW